MPSRGFSPVSTRAGPCGDRPFSVRSGALRKKRYVPELPALDIFRQYSKLDNREISREVEAINSRELIAAIGEGALDERFQELYGSWTGQRERYIACIEEHIRQFGEKETLSLFSSPGRVGLGGSHTDHQNGRVLAATIDRDIIGAVGANAHSMLRVASEGFRPESVDLWDLRMKDRERARPAALIRGIAAQVKKRGYSLAGFDLCATSAVRGGDGLSSSASFELLIAAVLNSLFCGEECSPLELAIMAHQAEREYFGRPSGLMNQTACAVGDCVLLDFANPEEPSGERIDFNLKSYGYGLVTVNCGASHTYLSDDLASIPADMRSVAQCFGREALREVSPAEFYESLALLRRRAGDKAVLRAAHFFDENQRVLQMAQAIKAEKIDDYFQLVEASSVSSQELLQNVYSERNPREQGLSVALCLARRLLCGGACRVQGDGFAGSIQAYVKLDAIADFVARMEEVFGEGCCHTLHVRRAGAIQVI